MPDTPNNLIASAADPIKAATGKYLRDRNAAQFEAAMQKALATHHTAAYLRGVAERSAGGKVRAWLSKVTGVSVLSKADRQALKEGIATQFDYLRGFVEAAPAMSDAAVASRAAGWPGSVQATYWGARTDNALPVYPGSCPQCYGRCRCDLTQEADGWHWNATNDKATCEGCRERGASWRPYKG